MISRYEVIKKHLVTERTSSLRADNKYVFAVDNRSTKPQIVEAVEHLFKVKVTKVNTSIMPGKIRRRMFGRPGQTQDWKKAIVTLASGQEIKALEGTA